MAAQEDHQRHLSRSIIRTPTPPLSPVAIQVTPSSNSHSQSRQPPLTPNAHLAPARPFYNRAATPSFASTSFGPSSATPTTAAPTPIELPALPAPPSETEAWDDLSSSAIESFDLGALRSKLNLANQLIKTLSSSLSSLRTTATHYTLQHKLLMLENSEAAARHQVESDITRREVEVLRLDQGPWNTNQQTALAEENELYKRRLRRAKRSLREHREDLGELRDEIEKLKKRIRDNRQHQHQLEASRSPGCPTSSSATADQQRLTTRREDGHRGPSRAPGPHNALESDTNNEDDGLAALGLLASQVLSQEMVEEDPSSDHRRHHHHHHHHHHHSSSNPNHQNPHPRLRKPRKQHHLPSITTTLPPSANSSSQNARPSLLSPLAFTSSSAHQKRHRSRSRDSTISASEGEDKPEPSKRRARVPLQPPLPVIDRLGGSPEKKKQKRGTALTPPPRKLPPGATPVSPPHRDRDGDRDRTPALP